MVRKTLHKAVIFVLSASIMLLTTTLVQAKKLVVSVNGSDSGTGSELSPFKTISGGTTDRR